MFWTLPSKSMTIGTLLEYLVDKSRTASLDGSEAVDVATVVIAVVDVAVAAVVIVVTCVVDAAGVVVTLGLHSKDSQGHPDLQLALKFNDKTSGKNGKKWRFLNQKSKIIMT